jgi:selenocysteine-specific elongation factor
VRVLPQSPWPLRHRARVRLHAGTHEAMAEVRLLAGAALAPGERGFAQLLCAGPVACWGRQPIVIRSESPLHTIGGGMVLLTAPIRLRRGDERAGACLQALRGGDDLERAAMVAWLAGGAGVTPMDICRELDLPQAQAAALFDRLVEGGTAEVLRLGHGRTMALHRDTQAAVRLRVAGAMERLHRETPLQARVPRERLARRLSDVDGALLAAVTEQMRASGALSGDESGLALPQFKPLLTEAQRGLHQRLLAAFERGGFSPPDPLELARATRVPEEQCRRILELCVGDGTLVHLEGSLYLHATWERTLRELVRGRLGNGAGLSVSEIRDLLGTSRKYAVPFCEHLDRAGVTRRQGDLRVLK